MQGEGGLDFLLDLPEAVALRNGDGLAARGRADRRSRAPRTSRWPRSARATPLDLVRLAWHLGNRHLPVADRGRPPAASASDHVIEAMLASLGATVTHVEAPFDPEGGAYAATATSTAHGHHDHDHDHA